MKIEIVTKGCMPTKATKGSAGWDLYAAESRSMDNNGSYKIDCGIKIELPRGVVALLCLRSGLVKRGLSLGNGVGVIDSDYRGLVCALINSDNTAKGYTIKKGDRIAQLVLVHHLTDKWIVTEKVDDTERGEGGFGSSGV